MKPVVLGLDIGGANLKAALSTGQARTRQFRLTIQPDLLVEEIRFLIEGMAFDRVAVTMSAESCDCFATKRQGVKFVQDVVGRLFEPENVQVWGLDQRFHPLQESANLLNFAASNWLALARFAGRLVQDPAVLIDVGSTTTDVVALCNGEPVVQGMTDSERLRTGELLYTGIRNTPICALLGSHVIAELFATTLDAYSVLKMIPESPTDCETADGRPATHDCAHARLARMLGGDTESIEHATTIQLAQRVRDSQIARIRESISRVREGFVHRTSSLETSGAIRKASSHPIFITAGSGEFLALAAIDDGPTLSLSEKLGPRVSSAACAYAVSMLAAESL